MAFGIAEMPMASAAVSRISWTGFFSISSKIGRILKLLPSRPIFANATMQDELMSRLSVFSSARLMVGRIVSWMSDSDGLAVSLEATRFVGPM